MANTIHNLGDVWHRMPLVQRIALIAAGVVVLAAGGFLAKWATKPKMEVLFTNLEPENAASMVQKLKDDKVPYELAAGGTTILVPSRNVYSLKLAMAQEGLVGAGQGGYSILDKESLGTSPAKQRVNFVRAREGELVRTIKMIEGVAKCRVHINRPERLLFDKDKNQASASVVVWMKGGRRLSNGNISAIINLVAAGAGGGLTSDAVKLIDGANGDIVSTSGQSKEGQVADGIDRYLASVESAMARKVEEILEPAVGVGRVRVRVTAKVTRTSLEETIEKNAEGAVVVETIKSESSSTPSKDGSGKGAKTTKETIEKTRDPDKTITRRVQLPGEVTRKSVAVLVDLSGPKVVSSEDSSGEGESQADAKRLTLKDVEELVRTSLNIGQDDQLSVKEAALVTDVLPEMEVEEAGLFSPDNIMELLRQSSLGILVIGALIALKMFGGSKSKKGKGGTNLLAGSDADISAMLEGNSGGDMSNLLPSGESVAADPNILKGQISKALQENPEEVKRLFLSWAESDGGEV